MKYCVILRDYFLPCFLCDEPIVCEGVNIGQSHTEKWKNQDRDRVFAVFCFGSIAAQDVSRLSETNVVVGMFLLLQVALFVRCEDKWEPWTHGLRSCDKGEMSCLRGWSCWN